MSNYKDKTLLISGGNESALRLLAIHAIEGGAKEVRVLDGDESRLITMREKLISENPEAAAIVKFCVGDVCDLGSVSDIMTSVDVVLYFPDVKNVNDVESYPAIACRTFLSATDNIIQAAIRRGTEKVLVIGNTLQEPLVSTPDLLSAMLEKIVVAQGRYQVNDSKTSICYVRLGVEDDVIDNIDFALTEAQNGDIVAKQANGFERVPCYNPGFERDDFTNN